MSLVFVIILVTFQFIFIVASENINQPRSCSRDESRYYNHNDVQEIVRFITSKDCNLDEEIIEKSEYLSKLVDHGCWCKTIENEDNNNNFNFQPQHGHPIDPVDKSCRTWHTCQKCVEQEICETHDSRIFQIAYHAESKTFACLPDLGSNCSYEKCLCTLNLAGAVYEKIKEGSKKYRRLEQKVDRSCGEEEEVGIFRFDNQEENDDNDKRGVLDKNSGIYFPQSLSFSAGPSKPIFTGNARKIEDKPEQASHLSDWIFESIPVSIDSPNVNIANSPKNQIFTHKTTPEKPETKPITFSQPNQKNLDRCCKLKKTKECHSVREI